MNFWHSGDGGGIGSPWEQKQLHLLGQGKLKGDKSYWFSFMNPGTQLKYKDTGKLTDEEIVKDYGSVIIRKSLKKDKDAVRRALISGYRTFNDKKTTVNLANAGLTFNYKHSGGAGNAGQQVEERSRYRHWAKANGLPDPSTKPTFFGSIVKGWEKAPKDIKQIVKDAPAQVAGLVKAATDVKTIEKGWKKAEKQLPEAFESTFSYFGKAIPDSFNIAGGWYKKKIGEALDWMTYYAEDAGLIVAGPVLFLVLLVIE